MGRDGLQRILMLLVTLMAYAAGPGGEICRYWTEGVESPAGAFQCPEPGKWGNAGATVCCGTCSAPYCCSSEEARLEQDRCPGGGQLLVSSVPPATQHRPYSFYIAVVLTTATLLCIIAYIIYYRIFLPLRTYLRARRRVRQRNVPPSRVSFQGPSPNFTYGLGSRLQSPNPPPLYHTLAAIPLANPPPSRADTPAQSSQEDSGLPEDTAAGSSPSAALLDTATSSGTPGPEE